MLTSGAGTPKRVEDELDLGMADVLKVRARTGEGREQATDAFRNAWLTGLRLAPRTAVRAGRAWGAWASEEGDWESAVRALGYSLDAVDRLHRVQGGRKHREAVVEQQGLAHTDAAVAWVRARDPEKAPLMRTRHQIGLLEHTAIHLIANAIARNVGVPQTWPDGRFDVIFVFTLSGSEHRFSRVPEMLLAGDDPEPTWSDQAIPAGAGTP